MGDPVNLTDHKEELFCGLTEMPEFSRREIISMGRCLLQEEGRLLSRGLRKKRDLEARALMPKRLLFP